MHRLAQPGEWVEWTEPSESGANRICRMSYEDTAKHQKYCVRADGHFYADDREAVEDFMVVNWAWTVIQVKTPVSEDGTPLGEES